MKPISTGIICHLDARRCCRPRLKPGLSARSIFSLSKTLEIPSVPPTTTLANSSDSSSFPPPKVRTSRSNTHRLPQFRRRHPQDESRTGSRVRPCYHPPQRRRGPAPECRSSKSDPKSTQAWRSQPTSSATRFQVHVSPAPQTENASSLFPPHRNKPRQSDKFRLRWIDDQFGPDYTKGELTASICTM